MTTDEKFAAIKALDSDVHLRMRGPGDWYVAGHAEIKKGIMLGGPYGNGDSPYAAIEDHWEQVALNVGPGRPNGECLVMHAMDPVKRREVYWNGFMWQDVTR